MRQPRRASGSVTLKDLLVLDRLVTGPIVNLMYWAGLGGIALIGFAGIGATVGVAIREGPMGWLAAFSGVIMGLLVMVVLLAIWRGFCEFYLVIFRISEDLRALREANDAEAARRPAGGFPPNP